MITNLNSIYDENSKKNIMIIDNNACNNILFIGSCRIYAFLNYFSNDDFFGKKFNYLCILVYNPAMVELSKCITEKELYLIQKSTILVSEYLKKHNYFNSSKDSEHNIFKLHTFEHTFFLPNFCNPKLYVKDILYYEPSMKELFRHFLQNKVSINTLSAELKQYHMNELNRYCNVIKKSNMPELEDFVRNNINKNKLAYTINHPTNFILFEMYRLLMHNWNRNISESVDKINRYEFFKDNEISRTYYDKICLNIHIEHLDKINSDKYLLSENYCFK